MVGRAEHDGLTPLVIVDHGLEVLDELVVLDDIVEVGDGVVSMAGVVNTLTMTCQSRGRARRIRYAYRCLNHLDKIGSIEYRHDGIVRKQ